MTLMGLVLPALGPEQWPEEAVQALRFTEPRLSSHIPGGQPCSISLA